MAVIPPPAALTTFDVPLRLDERFYGVRRDLMGWVTGPTEISGTDTEIKFDIDQRWQTKRGMEGQQHVVDWIELDTNFEIFPDATQNFGSNAGFLDYDFHWFVGDRLTLISYGGYDFFNDGQRYTAVGGFISRPPRGSLYLGFNDYQGGPISSDVVHRQLYLPHVAEMALDVRHVVRRTQSRQHRRKLPPDSHRRIVPVHDGYERRRQPRQRRRQRVAHPAIPWPRSVDHPWPGRHTSCRSVWARIVQRPSHCSDEQSGLS